MHHKVVGNNMLMQDCETKLELHFSHVRNPFVCKSFEQFPSSRWCFSKTFGTYMYARLTAPDQRACWVHTDDSNRLLS